MILLSAASIAGLIASIVLYSQDSVTDAQWKILGMVVCAIMLITIIITLLVFIYCYKNGYMFNNDEDDIDINDPSTNHDIEGNERQKAVLRKIYKFNRPNERTPVPSNVLQDVSSPPSSSSSISHIPVPVNDKQTNTDTTIAPLPPKDLDRGVWASINAYGGVAYRPLIAPQMTSRFIQVLPQEIDETYQIPQVIYQVVAPATTVIPTAQMQPRIVQIPAPPAPIFEVVEPKKNQTRIIPTSTHQVPAVEVIQSQKKQSRIIPTSEQQLSMIEVIEPSKKQQRTTIIRQPQTQQIIVQQTPRIEYVEEQRPRRVVQQTEYVDIDDQRPRRVIQQPTYEIVEEIVDRSTSASTSSMEEIVEIVDAPKNIRQRERKKGKRHKTGTVSVKHINSNGEIVENRNRK